MRKVAETLAIYVFALIATFALVLTGAFVIFYIFEAEELFPRSYVNFMILTDTTAGLLFAVFYLYFGRQKTELKRRRYERYLVNK